MRGSSSSPQDSTAQQSDDSSFLHKQQQVCVCVSSFHVTVAFLPAIFKNHPLTETALKMSNLFPDKAALTFCALLSLCLPLNSKLPALRFRAEHIVSRLQRHACVEPISSARDTALVEEGDHYGSAPADLPPIKRADNIKGQRVIIFKTVLFS